MKFSLTKLIILHSVIVLLQLNISYCQYFEKSKINKEETERQIYKLNNVKKITSYNIINDKLEEKFLDKDGYVIERRRYDSEKENPEKKGYDFDSIHNSSKKYSDKEIRIRDSIGRITNIYIYNSLDSLTGMQFTSFLPGNRELTLYYDKGVLLSKFNCIKDSLGNIMENQMTYYYLSDSMESRYSNIYDNNANLIETKYYYSYKNVINIMFYEFNELRDELNIFYIDSNQNKKRLEYYTYDRQNRIEKHYRVDSNDAVLLVHIYEYNESGQKLKDTFHSKNIITYVLTNKYLDNGLIKEVINCNYNQGEEDCSKSNYEYDKRGLLKKTKEYDEKGVLFEFLDYVYEYY